MKFIDACKIQNYQKLQIYICEKLTPTSQTHRPPMTCDENNSVYIPNSDVQNFKWKRKQDVY